MAGLLDDTELVRRLLGQMGDTISSPGRTGRPYIGYEDDSQQGRAAIGAFNSAGGPNNLGYNDPNNPYGMKNYLKAIIEAKMAAEMNMRQQDEQKNKSNLTMAQLLGYEQVPEVPLSFFKYKYPPR